VNQVTEMLDRMAQNDRVAAAELLPLVYDELRRIAAAYMGHERRDHTLQPTALIHEAFLKLAGAADESVEADLRSRPASFRGREHFIGVAARAMRQVLVDHARRSNAAKRGGDWMRVTLDQSDPNLLLTHDDILALHDALTRLAEKHARIARVVELRYFGGLTIQEAAAALDVSHTTVEDDWSIAKAWLARELGAEDGGV
jgi:RNA polymerase sigma-70 factor, ECF subfamily